MKRYPYPAPTRAYDALHYTATMRPGGGTTDTTFTLTISATDGDGDITFGGLTWGDGQSVSPEAVPQHCPVYPSPTAAPGPYKPQPDKETFVYRHRYAASGDYQILITVNSGNNSCRPHGPARESQTVRLSVHVSPSESPAPAAP